MKQLLDNLKSPANRRSFISKLSWWKSASALALLCAATAIASPAQTFTPFYKFTAGGNPNPDLVQSADGSLHGTTQGFAFPGAYPGGMSGSVNWS
jgi:hypothetical protein